MDLYPDIETANGTATISIPENNVHDEDFAFLDEFIKSCGATTEQKEEENGDNKATPKDNNSLLLQQSYNVSSKLVINVGLGLNHNFVGTVKIHSSTSSAISTIIALLWDEWSELMQHIPTISSFFSKSTQLAVKAQHPRCQTCGSVTKMPIPTSVKITDDLCFELVKKSKCKVVNLHHKNDAIQFKSNDLQKFLEIAPLISQRLNRLHEIHFIMFYNNLINTIIENPMQNVSTVEYVNLILDKYVKSKNFVYENLEAMCEIVTIHKTKVDEDVLDMKNKTKRKHSNVSGCNTGGKRIKIY